MVARPDSSVRTCEIDSSTPLIRRYTGKAASAIAMAPSSANFCHRRRAWRKSNRTPKVRLSVVGLGFMSVSKLFDRFEQGGAVDVEPQLALDEGGAADEGSEPRRRQSRVRFLVLRPAQAP